MMFGHLYASTTNQVRLGCGQMVSHLGQVQDTGRQLMMGMPPYIPYSWYRFHPNNHLVSAPPPAHPYPSNDKCVPPASLELPIYASAADPLSRDCSIP